MAGGVNGPALAAVAAGSVFLYASIKGKSVTKSLQALIQGKSPASVTGTPVAGTGAPAAPASAGGNVALGKMLAQPYGWSSGPEWDALYALWERESGWSNTADTRQSGLDAPGASVFAYGIPQARPYSKMPKPAWPPDKGGKADPSVQITWGLNYIKGRYGDPLAAWAEEQSAGSY